MSRLSWKRGGTLLAAATWFACLAPSALAADEDAQTLEELREAVKALKQHIGEQDRRIAELEGRAPAGRPPGEKAAVEDAHRIAGEVAARAAQDANGFKIVWDNGVWFRSGNGQFGAHVGGRIFADWGWIRAPGIERDNPDMGQPAGTRLVLRDGQEFRAIRLWGEGVMYRYLQYRVEADFARGKVVPKDAFIRLTDIPLVGNFTVGHFKEPFSLEEMTSDAGITFMGRSLANTAVPARNPGFMLSGAFLGEKKSERMTYAIGLFRQECIGDTGVDDGATVNSERGYAMTARVTGLPWFENGGERLLHLGLAYSVRGTNDDRTLRYRARPEAQWVQYRFLDTGSLANVDHVQLLGAEAAAVVGPFSVQGEAVSALVGFGPGAGGTGSSRDDVCYNGFYVQASCFLTPGDRRSYSTGGGAFGAVKPSRNFRQDGGWGAVEVAARFSYLDLDEADLGGMGRGELHGWTLGANWYLNPNARVMANYILSMPNRVDTRAEAGIFMMRFQLDF